MADITDGLAAFAAGTLGRAAGRDFLGPMLEDTRAKDRFLFQQREAVRLREEARKKDTEERRASRRGLISALQAAGAVRPEDVVAAGGVETLADLEDSEFTIVQQTLQRNRLKDLSDEEQRQLAISQARVRGITVPDTVGKNEVIDLLAQADYHDLTKEQGKQQRDESTRALRTTIGQAARDIGVMFERPQAVTVDTLRSAFGRHQQAAARLASEGAELSDADYGNLQDELNSMADEIRRQQVHVELNALAKEPPARIIAGLTQLDPDLRSLALERPSIASAWSRVEYAANQLVGLGEEGAGRLGMGELYKQALEGDPAQDGALAQSLAAAAGKISEGPRLLKQMEAGDAGMAEAQATAKAVNSLGFANTGLELQSYINPKTGDFDRAQYLRDAYSEQLMAVEDMDPVAAQDFLTTLAAAGAPVDMQRVAAKGAQRGFARSVGESRPDSLLDLSTQRNQIERQEDVAHGALQEILAVPPEVEQRPQTFWEGASSVLWSGPGTGPRGGESRTRVSSEYLAKLRGAVEATGKPLAEQRAAVDAWGQTLVEKIRDARQAGDEDLATAYMSASQERDLLKASLEVRSEVRGQLVNMLKSAAPIFGEFKGSAGGTDDETKSKVLQAFGVGAEQAAEGAAQLTDTASILGAMRDQALAGLKNRTTEQGAAEAVSAEIDRLYELTLRLDAALQDPDTLKLYRQAGIIRGQAGDAPALELLAYLL